MAAHLAAIAVERRQSEFAVRESEGRFRRIFESITDAILVVDPQWRLLDANPAAERLFDRSREDLLAAGLHDLLAPQCVETLIDSLPKLAEGALPFVECEGKSTDGSGTPVCVRASDIVYRGQPMWLLYARDLTARRQAELESREQQDRLAHVSRLTTIGELVAGLTHEIAQPVNTILNYAEACSETLSHGGDEAAAQEHLQGVREAAERTRDIIQRLRSFLVKSKPQRHECRINEIVGEALRLLANELRTHGVSVTLALAPDEPMVLADRVQVQQVLVNIVKNACEALQSSPPEHRTVTIRSTLADNEICVEVEDWGASISPDIAPRIFDVFSTTKTEGMGMGLAICRSIIESHGGRIWAVTNRTNGATLCFTLPVVGAADRGGTIDR